MPLEPSTSLTPNYPVPPYTVVEHLPDASPLHPKFCRLSSQECLLSCRQLSYIRLIVHLETSTRQWISFLEHSLCRSNSSGNVWSRLFYIFLARDGSHSMTSRVSREITVLGATALFYTASSSRLLVPSNPKYGASLSRWTTIIFALGCR